MVSQREMRVLFSEERIGWLAGTTTTTTNTLLEKLFLFKKLCLFIFERQRETEHKQGWGGERGTQSLKQAPGSEASAQSPMQGSNPRTARS